MGTCNKSFKQKGGGIINLEIRIDDKTADLLREIAKLKDCSVQMAARIVLERYAERAKNEIEKAQRAAEHALGK